MSNEELQRLLRQDMSGYRLGMYRVLTHCLSHADMCFEDVEFDASECTMQMTYTISQDDIIYGGGGSYHADMIGHKVVITLRVE